MLENAGKLLEKRILGPNREKGKQEAGENFVVRRICVTPAQYCRDIKKGERFGVAFSTHVRNGNI
jgi:hypothetical protein